MDHVFLIPEFNRLADWAGLWSMEPRAFETLAGQLRRIDIAAHMKEPTPTLVSAMKKIPARNGQSVAVIEITGTLMKSQSSMGGTSTVQLRRDIRQASTDSEVSSILLAIDSPGGTVAGTDDLATEVRNARKQKPVVAHIDDLGASAAYWVASQAEAIYANSPTAVIGSIGTVATIYDSSEAAAKEGVKAFRFATGPLKGAGTEGTVLTEEQQAAFQQMVDESQKTFDAAVKRGRNMTDSQLNAVRTGGIWLGESAVAMNLIDGVRPLSKTLEEMTRASSKTPVRAGYQTSHLEDWVAAKGFKVSELSNVQLSSMAELWVREHRKI